MADDEIKNLSSRPLLPDEQRLLQIFDKIEESSLDHLDEGARQIIQLVTALYGVIFGVLALGAEKMGAELHRPLVLVLGIAAVLAFLVALLAAAWAVLPQPYYYRSANLTDKKARYTQMIEHKSRTLYVAFVAFAFGAILFALLVIGMLYWR